VDYRGDAACGWRCYLREIGRKKASATDLSRFADSGGGAWQFVAFHSPASLRRLPRKGNRPQSLLHRWPAQVCQNAPRSNELSIIGLFDFRYVELLHLKHRLKSPLRFFGFVIAQQFVQLCGNDLPGKTEFVFQPSALLSLFISAL
jgi:hypothetical protein